MEFPSEIFTVIEAEVYTQTKRLLQGMEVTKQNIVAGVDIEKNRETLKRLKINYRNVQMRLFEDSADSSDEFFHEEPEIPELKDKDSAVSTNSEQSINTSKDKPKELNSNNVRLTRQKTRTATKKKKVKLEQLDDPASLQEMVDQHSELSLETDSAFKTKRKRSSCTLKEKLEVLERLDNGESVKQLSLEFGVKKNTISDWKKNRAKLKHFCDNTNSEVLNSRYSLASVSKLSELIFLWFNQEKQKGVAVNGPMIQEKALQFNKMMQGDPTFTASSGWLDRWKKRHGVHLATTSRKVVNDDTEGQDFPYIYRTDDTEVHFTIPTSSTTEPSSSGSHVAIQTFSAGQEAPHMAGVSVTMAPARRGPAKKVKDFFP